MTKGERASPKKNMVAEAPTALKSFACDMVNLKKMENGFSKGVVLDVTRFDEPSKSKAMEAKEGSEEMSLTRKIAFGFSFLPSVFFVLCFAVILPCKEVPPAEPCVRERWALTFNGTAPTLKLNLPKDLIFAYSKDEESRLASLTQSEGVELWNATLKSKAGFVDCLQLDWNNDGVEDCLVMDDSGWLYIFNASNGYLFEQKSPGTDKRSNPAVVPDCEGSSSSTLAQAISHGSIRIRQKDAASYEVAIPPCNDIPSQVMAWTRNGTTDIIYYCEQKSTGKGAIVSIPEGEWCSPKSDAASVSVLIRMFGREGLAHATDDALIVWTEDAVSMVRPDGTELWEVETTNHFANRRSLKYGRFFGGENQVALLSSNDSVSLVSTLHPSSGNVTWSKSIPDVEISDVHLLTGKDKDYLLVALQRMKIDVGKEAVARLNEVTTTIVNLLSNEEVNVTRELTLVQQIALMELGIEYSLHTLRDNKISLDRAEDNVFPNASLAVKADGNRLNIVFASVAGNKQLQLRGIEVENWDVASPSSKCTLQ